ncbi:hypothetical protein M9458_013567 [Cirrhinus mrigala]|uniref:ribonuclease H n=1 Tax=Cirrhinus mrigala TaxID=683832 RepID=A0ABD0QXF2_CIRMR
MSQMFENFEGVLCHADDVLVCGRNRQEHDQRLHRVLQKMQEEGLTLNEKCEFRQEHSMFVGHRVSSKGIEPDPNKVKAILQMPELTQVEDVRRLMGMANYLSKFVPQMATITMPLKDLLREKNEWVWGEPQQTAFKKLKSGLSSPKALAQYSNTAETKVAADASPYGIGAILTQKQADNSWQPVTYISRGLTDTEKRYAQIEKEALAVTWACERLTSYLQGLHFTLQTDHKPLVPLLSTRGLDDLPPRVLRFRLRLLRYDYNIVHVPGKNLITADTLSRAPLTDTPSAEDLQLEKEVQVFVDAVVSSLPVTDTRLEKIKQAQQTDETCKIVARYCQTAWPQKHGVSTGIVPYWQVRAELYLVGDLLMKEEKYCTNSTKVTKGSLNAVPELKLQYGDQVSLHRFERQWTDVKCVRDTEHNTESPYYSHKSLTGPGKRNKTYLLIIDYFSRYIEVAELRVTSAEATVHAVKEAFAHHGYPETVVSDNGPQLFAEESCFTHVMSSPRYPQANGEAERAVQTVKCLWKKDTDQTRALLAYRATLLEHGYSPAQLLMGRNLRTSLPQSSSQLTPQWPDLEAFRRKDEEGRRKQAIHYNLRHRTEGVDHHRESSWDCSRDCKQAKVIPGKN